MIEINAYAKLNLSLDVTERREDGYHNMAMVMQTVSLSDSISIEINETGKISAVTDLHFIPSDERNLAVKTAMVYFDATKRTGQGVTIKIKKRIPVGAGMAGGSADAAAVLRGLNTLFKDGLGRLELEEMADKIGSDVVFCVSGGTALVRGRGEQISPLPPMPDCYFAICKPNFSISTPELFRKIDSIRLRSHPDTAGMVDAVNSGDLPQLCRRMYNVFEDVDDRRLRTVADIKSKLLDCGAMGAVMTGTGSAVFGVFTEEDAAENARAVLQKDYGFCRVARPQGSIF